MKKKKNLVKSPPRPVEKSPESDLVDIHESYAFSGPLPPPAILNKYDEKTRTVIVEMAHQQSTHRQGIELAVISSNIRNERAGMFIAATLTVVMMLGGMWLVANDKEATGLLVTFIPVLFHAGNYIYNKTQENDVKQTPAPETKPDSKK
jgi:uncharacterized membrane protein